MKKKVIPVIILLLIAGGIVFFNSFRLEQVQVSGCVAVDEQTIIDAIENQSIAKNTILIYLANKFAPIEDIPFVAKMDMEFISKNIVSVTVYEKSMAGCVEYMNRYIYFDKDGIVLESSPDIIEGIPCIRGLHFDKWEIGEKLPVSEDSKFQSILTITQLIEKYKLDIDGIKFTAENEIILEHAGISIELGEGEYLAVQMMNLGSILEGLEGLEGTLHMK